MAVTIKRLRGEQLFRRGSGFKKEIVDTEFDEILDEGQRVGYILHKPDASVCLITQISPSVEAQIQKAVAARDEQMGWAEPEGNIRKVTRPPIVPQELLEE